MEKIPFTFFLKELSITIKDGITPISHNVKVYTEGFRDGVRRKCQYYKMPLTAALVIFSWIISTGIFSYNNRRLEFSVFDDILINTRGYTIVFENGSEAKLNRKTEFYNFFVNKKLI